jgi:hypothetical protein
LFVFLGFGGGGCLGVCDWGEDFGSFDWGVFAPVHGLTIIFVITAPKTHIINRYRGGNKVFSGILVTIKVGIIRDISDLGNSCIYY